MTDQRRHGVTRRDFLKASGGLVAGGAVLSAGAQAVRAAGPVRLGALLPLSGSLASTGDLLKRAMELAVELVNTPTPGVNLKFANWAGIPSLGGAKVEVIWGDTRAQPAVGADLATRMIADQKVVGLIGAFNSDVTAAASTVAERMKTPMINEASSSPALTKRGLKYFFRVSPHEQTFVNEAFLFLEGLKQGKAQGVGAIPKDKLERVAIATETTEIGRLLAELYQQAAAKFGYKVVATIRFKLGSPDLTSEMKELKASNPDVLLTLAGISDAILLTKTMKREGVAPKVYYMDNYGASDPNYVRTLGRDADHIVLRSVFSDKLLGKPVTQQVNELYKKKAGVPLTDLSARAFSAMQAWLEVLNRAGSTEPDAIVKAAEGLTIPKDETIMPWDGINFVTTEFGDTHQNGLGRGLILQYQRGQGEVMWPFELATAKLVYPFGFAG